MSKYSFLLQSEEPKYFEDHIVLDIGRQSYDIHDVNIEFTRKPTPVINYDIPLVESPERFCAVGKICVGTFGQIDYDQARKILTALQNLFPSLRFTEFTFGSLIRRSRVGQLMTFSLVTPIHKPLNAEDSLYLSENKNKLFFQADTVPFACCFGEHLFEILMDQKLNLLNMTLEPIPYDFIRSLAIKLKAKTKKVFNMQLAVDLREERYSLQLNNPIIMDPANDKIPTERFCGIIHVSYTERCQLYVQGMNANINDQRWTESSDLRNCYILFSNFDKSPIPNELKPIKFDASRRFSCGGEDIFSLPNPTLNAYEEFFAVAYQYGKDERLSLYWPASIARKAMA